MKRDIESYAERGKRIVYSKEFERFQLSLSEILYLANCRDRYDSITKAFFIGIEAGQRIARKRGANG